MTEALPTRQRLLLALAKLKREAGPDAKAGPSISAVAREAGVSHTLVHTKYPDIAEKIREGSGRGPKQQLATQRQRLKRTEDRAAELRHELAQLRDLNRQLASENARLTLLVLRLEGEVSVLESGVPVLRPKPQAGGKASEAE
ncbi:TetR family transcriptional regulator [Cupriavidus basilensis]|uniref:TetR family transcriptional regulator n=1 Tax=Cupriavidus basilensis TaxID=68895 RepID=UPI0039F7168E